MGIAARIADNLTSTDDASDEDVNAEIEAAIDAVLPYLQVSQSFCKSSNRRKPQKRMTMTKPMTAMIHHRTLQTIVRRVQTKMILNRIKVMMMLQHGQRDCLTRLIHLPMKFRC